MIEDEGTSANRNITKDDKNENITNLDSNRRLRKKMHKRNDFIILNKQKQDELLKGMSDSDDDLSDISLSYSISRELNKTRFSNVSSNHSSISNNFSFTNTKKQNNLLSINDLQKSNSNDNTNNLHALKNNSNSIIETSKSRNETKSIKLENNNQHSKKLGQKHKHHSSKSIDDSLINSKFLIKSKDSQNLSKINKTSSSGSKSKGKSNKTNKHNLQLNQFVNINISNNYNCKILLI